MDKIYFPSTIQNRLYSLYINELCNIVEEMEKARKLPFSKEREEKLEQLHEYMQLLCQLSDELKQKGGEKDDPDSFWKAKYEEEVYL